MYVCQCHAITDTTIQTTIECGANDVDDVALLCGAATKCGGCYDEIARMCAAMRERPQLTSIAS